MRLLFKPAWAVGVAAAFGAMCAMAGCARESSEASADGQGHTAEALVAHPTTDWVTNGGNIFNQRYSPLDQINPDTVGGLKGVWRASLDGSGVGPGYSGEAQPLVEDGVIYTVTGDNDVFAVDVATGEFKWVYEANLDLTTVNVCCGWLSRGVGLSEDKIFVGRLDAKLVALDKETGEVAWEIQAADPARGYSITSAPLYYDGMVITGFAGGEYGIRGRVTAYDAETGEEVWNFFTVPGPGEFGHDTWPQDNDAWMYGAAAVWQTPAIDPELGMIYFSTGNPGPDLNGAIRAGDNLFSVSIVALDVATGEYRWHFQEIHHDIWDYDAPNPVILFDAEIDGVTRKGVAQANKGGYLYILDRTTGEPLTPIVETPVPQEPTQATAPTQPIPQGDWVVPHEIDVLPETEDAALINQGRTFTPFRSDERVIYKPFAAVNWMPSSYDPTTNLMYVCAGDRIGGAFGGDADAMVGPPEGQQYIQGGFAGGDNPKRALLVAMDLTDHMVAWRREVSGDCRGTLATGGGLVFVGREDGRLTAMDSETGLLLWEFQTDGGVNASATTFERDGEQYLVVLAGGGILAGGKQTDGLWLFSLNGTMESMPAGSADRGPPSGPPVFAAPPAVPSDRVADLQNGAQIYATVCQACHGQFGEGGHDQGAPLPDDVTVQSVMYTADSGVPGTNMQPFRGFYTDEEIHDVASFIVEVVLADR